MYGLFLLKRTTGPYSRFQRPIEIRGSCTAINEEISTGDESAFAAHQQFRHISHLIRCARTSSRALGKHILVEVPAGAVKLVDSQRCDDDSRRDGINPGTLFAP